MKMYKISWSCVKHSYAISFVKANSETEAIDKASKGLDEKFEILEPEDAENWNLDTAEEDYDNEYDDYED